MKIEFRPNKAIDRLKSYRKPKTQTFFQSYKELAAEAGAVLNRDPRLIQFFKQGPFNRDQPGQPIKSTETRNIEEILYVASQSARDTRRPTKRIYYQVCS